ncbi:MAG: CHAT domain-containing protein [Bacteroidetes bacterium]|nr:MAG: CHAT domain-containing protein [Bacteroidota bacterium]
MKPWCFPVKCHTMPLPAILIAFANNRTPGQYLSELEKEQQALLDKFSGKIEPILLQQATLDRIVDRFNKFPGRIRIFHFAGHANPDALLLEPDAEGFDKSYAAGLAAYIGSQNSVSLVFLNGCSTRAQVDLFIAAGIQAVIATTRPIRDDVARLFATDFYTSFCAENRENSIQKAFDDACNLLNTRFGDAPQDIYDTRSLHFGSMQDISGNPYELSIKGRAVEIRLKDLEKGEKALNETLTRQLTEAIRPYSTDAERLLKYVQAQGISNWESQLRYSDKAKQIIAYSFVGVIGIQLSKLMAIGKEDMSEGKPRKYIEKCIYIAARSLDLLCFALISALWDAIAQQPRTLSAAQQARISRRLDENFEPSLPDQLDLLRTLHEIFSQPENGLTVPIPELAALGVLAEGSDFQQTIRHLHALNEKLDKSQYDLLDCFEAENQLATLLGALSFLVSYRMASIKHIGYNQTRHADPGYLHRYTALGIDSKANVDAEKINYTSRTAHTDAVLLYHGGGGHYQSYVNLSPFVIDYNALTGEHGAKICFYRSQDIGDGTLEYLFLEDNSLVRIEKKGILKPDSDFNELMISSENRKVFNLDNVVDQFREAQRCLGGETLNFDDL